MNPCSYLLGMAGVIFWMPTAALAESPATNTPPGPLTTSVATEPQPETPAPPQKITKSAPGAQSPNGANGINLAGKPVTKGPNTPAKELVDPNAAPATASASAAPTPASALNAPPSPAAQKGGSVLDHYLQDLNDALKLSGDEKKDIQTYYLEDGPTVQGIINNASISPIQQAQQVADIRDKRDDKIEALLDDPDRRRDFFKVEADYRVALTEATAEGEMCPAQPPAPAPAPSDVTPGQAEPIPTKNDGGK